MQRLRIEREGHIAHVVLTRPEKKNAMDDAMIDALILAGSELAADVPRAVVMSGEGDCFCAGIDLASLQAYIGADMQALLLPRSHGAGTTNRWQEVAMLWQRLPCPVIAALHGAVFGAGLQLALGADIRIAAPDARLSVMEIRWGIVPDMGGTVLLSRLLRADVMKRMVLTAEIVPAGTAERLGLVTEVTEAPLARATALAGEIASRSPAAVRAGKALCNKAFAAPPDEMLLAEAEAQAALMNGPEQMEVVRAHLEGRDPVFL